MRVCILGCGPAGLLAAYAADLMGHSVSIISKRDKSLIPGAVFLHQPIPGLTAPDPDGAVRFIKHGDRYGYALKVYGAWDADCSWDLFEEGERPAWSMFAIYDKLWKRYAVRIMDGTINTVALFSILELGFDLIISTIPAPFLCHNDKHDFRSQNIYVLDKTVDPSLENAIVYNGSLEDRWYRTSKLFGAEATESTDPFPLELAAQFDAVCSKGYKPITTDCDCFKGQIERVGRFGRWEKGILVHHAYRQTVQILENV